jgi:light-harvesting protein B-800-850 alpha chain
MIYGKIWLVVKPTVGIPIFLGAVAVGSFAVHVALLTNTTWVPKFLNGNAAVAAPAATEADAGAAKKK